MSTLNYADINIGDKIPNLDIPITASLISCAALATRDFEPCHHDKAVAQAMGLPDVFMNILTSQSFNGPFRHRLVWPRSGHEGTKG